MTETGPESQVVIPKRPLSRKYLEAILALAERMSTADGEAVPKERKLIDQLAEAGGLKNFRHERWYKDLMEDAACGRLDIESAKIGALVVLALVLKADQERRSSEFDYYGRIKAKLSGPPVVVPINVEEHLALAMRYFKADR